MNNAAITAKVAPLLTAWTNTYKQKNSAYGCSWLLAGQTVNLWLPDGIVLKTPLQFIFYGLLTRMLDKLIRATNLILHEHKDAAEESVVDTLCDLGVYAFMGSALCSSGTSTVDPGQEEIDT